MWVFSSHIEKCYYVTVRKSSCLCYVALRILETEVIPLKPSQTPIRVALYARVSTFAGQDPEMQLRELREYCQRRGLQIVQEYVDKGISGSFATHHSALCHRTN